jgi:hypothetical protein
MSNKRYSFASVTDTGITTSASQTGLTATLDGVNTSFKITGVWVAAVCENNVKAVDVISGVLLPNAVCTNSSSKGPIPFGFSSIGLGVDYSMSSGVTPIYTALVSTKWNTTLVATDVITTSIMVEYEILD